MLRIALVASTLLFAPAAAAKDCVPMETAPGVRSKPAGCTDLGREAAPKKAADTRIKGSDGYITTQGGTKIRIGGQATYETGVGAGRR